MRDPSGSRRREVDIEIRFTRLKGQNFNQDRPVVSRADLIIGRITGPNPNPDADTNPTTSVEARFSANNWGRRGDELVIRYRLRDVEGRLYALVRGTNTNEDEPLLDGVENPWTDLWFYSNPVFIDAT